MTAARPVSSAAPTPAYPVRVFDVVVRRVRDMTPHFRRITFAGSDWALAAAPGAAAVIIGPHAHTAAMPLSDTGIRWDPQGARQVLLAGDETAVPAISSILEALPADVAGHAFLEVPDSTDFLEISTGSAVRITWLGRHASGASRGELLFEAVHAAAQTSDSIRHPGLYAWVGAEAGTVKALGRFLVNQIGLDPKRSEFRGYWSLGKAGSGTNGTPIEQLGHTIGSF